MEQRKFASKMTEARYERTMKLIEELTVLPTALNVPMRILDLYRDPKTSLEQFSQTIMTDGALSAKVLELANSAWFCPTTPVTKVFDALRMIGLNNLLPLLFGLSLAAIFNKAGLSTEERESLWQNALCKGLIARQWTRLQGIPLEEEAFLCGVLQDIALPAMFSADRSSSPELASIMDLPEKTRLEREIRLFGADHAEFGQHILNRSRLPELYVLSTATHHTTDGPSLPKEYSVLAPGLKLAARMSHGLCRIDERAVQPLQTAFAECMSSDNKVELAVFIEDVLAAAKSMSTMLGLKQRPSGGAGIFLQEVADHIAKSMFEAVGASVRLISRLESAEAEKAQRIRELESQMIRADYDPLTNVLNRRGFFSSAEKVMALARRHQVGCVVGFVDLNNFKSVNDRYGHGAGDQALVAMANVLRKIISGRGIVGRSGGDEFVFIALCTGEVTHIRIQTEVQQAVQTLVVPVGNEKATLHASVGVVWLGIPAPDETIEAAIKRADDQMYQAKRNAKISA